MQDQNNNGMAQAMQMIQMMMGLGQQQQEQQMAQVQQPLQMDLLRERIMSEQQGRMPDEARQSYMKSQTGANDLANLSQYAGLAAINPQLRQMLMQLYPGLNFPSPQEQVAAKHPDPNSEAIRQRAQQMMQQQQQPTQGGY